MNELERKHALLLKQLKNNLNKERKTLNEKYADIINKREELINEIHNNSVFAVSTIGPVLAKLISTYEGEDYQFKKGFVTINKADSSSGYYAFGFNYSYSAVLANSSMESFDKRKIFFSPRDRIENYIEKSLFLHFDVQTQEEVNFYNAEGHFLYNGQYSYIKDFIDCLISKRMSKKQELNIDEELNSFLKSNHGIQKKKIK